MRASMSLLLAIAVLIGFAGTTAASPGASAQCKDMLDPQSCDVCVWGIHPYMAMCAVLGPIASPVPPPCTCPPID
ncbi:MAG TPA: hypothetical protein VM681_04980 [Candidatus Thermoplasmatota archaeon]|nr:hypothetical protein [Candidatus Thermoplasmatota archaeon]